MNYQYHATPPAAATIPHWMKLNDGRSLRFIILVQILKLEGIRTYLSN